MTLTIDLPPSVDEAHARLLLAISLLQEDALTVSGAAETAGLSYRAFVDALHERRIPAFGYDDDNGVFEREMKTVRQMVQEVKERDTSDLSSSRIRPA